MTDHLSHKLNNKTPGFTLIELAVVILILGLIIGSMFTYFATKADQDTYQTTTDRQKRIAIALSDYAHLFGRLPCPARPNPIAPLGLGEAPLTCATDALRNGIVPFRVLGLTQQDATDGYGRPFTYGVSFLAVTPGATAHNYCRRGMIWTDGISTNYNPGKALFCCQRVTDANSILVNDAAAARIIPNQDSAAITGSFAAPSSSSFSDPVTPDRLTYFAYVLISHGKNGFGAFIFNSASPRAASAGVDEQENANNDRLYIDRPLNAQLPFDDIVFWRTQEQVMAETNNDTCARP